MNFLNLYSKPAFIVSLASILSFSFICNSYAQSPVLYGMTQNGGSSGHGAIISFNTFNNTEDTVWSFGRGKDGQNPQGNLVPNPNNGLFYGMTTDGGSKSVGAIIAFNPLTNTEDTVWSFGRGKDGQFPTGSLVYDANNGLFYGMTSAGGSLGHGTIIKFNPANNTEDTVWSFGRGKDGQNPQGPLVYFAANGSFYGLTANGGVNFAGAIIKFNPTNNTEDTVWSFGRGKDGQNPQGYLVYDATNGLFYGMTSAGGTQGDGAIIKFNPITNKDSVVWNLGTGTDGQSPRGSLTYYTGKGLFYGMTAGGGTHSSGTIISLNPVNNAESVVWNLGSGTDGKYPDGNLIFDATNGLFYGMTSGGGSSSDGTIITLNPSNNTESVVWNLGSGKDGQVPNGDLLLHVPCSLTAASATTTQEVLCYGTSTGSAQASVTGGVSPFTYSWSNGTSTASTNNPGNGLSAGSYTVTVHDANGCTVTASATITQAAAIVVTIDTVTTNKNVDSCNWVLSAKPNGGTSPYNYSWSPGGQTTSTIKGLCDGNYCCTVTDKNGCQNNNCAFVVTEIQNINNSSSIQIYPDPNQGHFTVAGATPGQVIELYNYMGEKVMSINATKTVTQVDISTQSSGIYLLRILNKSGTIVGEKKLVKTN